MNSYNREILRLALPSIATNVTVPLLGLVDLAIVGHIGNETMIGAIAVGSMIFNVMYWLMGFLRMGTTGMTANTTLVGEVLSRFLRLAFLIALCFLVLQVPLRWLSLWLMGPSEGVAAYVRVYFNICIWGAPAVLGLYVMSGWFIGMKDTRTPMIVSISQNLINILFFIPYGFFFPEKKGGWQAVALYGALFAVLIEVTQYVFILGWAEVDDVLSNTIGAVIGFFLWFCLHKLLTKSTAKSHPRTKH